MKLLRKILVLERIDKTGIEVLKKKFEVKVALNKKINNQIKLISKYDAIIIKSTTIINKKFLSNSGKLKLVARAGTGLDNIDQNLLKEKRINLIHTPNESTKSVAEFTLMLILLAIKNFTLSQKMALSNDFRRNKLIGKDLTNTTVGILGYGKIGKSVSKMLKLLKVKVLIHDPKFKKSNKMINVIRNSDIISLHLPLTSKTKNLVNRSMINKMKNNVILVNTSRAQLFEKYFYKNVNKRFKLYTDVILPEPNYNKKKSYFKHPWLKNKNIIFTPHIASMTDKTQENISLNLSKLIIKYFDKLDKKNR